MFYTHINRNIIDQNRRNGTNKPAVRFQKGKYGRPTYAHRVKLKGESEVLYSAGDPILPCGARLVISSTEEPEVLA